MDMSRSPRSPTRRPVRRRARTDCRVGDAADQQVPARVSKPTSPRVGWARASGTPAAPRRGPGAAPPSPASCARCRPPAPPSAGCDRVARERLAGRTSPRARRERPIRCCSAGRCASGARPRRAAPAHRASLVLGVAALLQRDQSGHAGDGHAAEQHGRDRPQQPHLLAAAGLGGPGPRGRGPRCWRQELALHLVRLVGLRAATRAPRPAGRRGTGPLVAAERLPLLGRLGEPPLDAQPGAVLASIQRRSVGQPRISASCATSTTSPPASRPATSSAAARPTS